jgi:cobalt-zinc-cadmium efflux system protein
MLTDVVGLALALIAMRLAHRPASTSMTYGYYRLEILAALVNAVLLLGVAAYILYEAAVRFSSPPDVDSLPLVVVAGVGLGVNLFSVFVLMAPSRESLNLRGAFLEVYSDLLGSAAAIVAGVILLTTGWRYADPLFAAGIGLFILPRTWALLRSSVDVLLEGTPSQIPLPDVQDAVLALPGVIGLHDLHIWTITSGFVAMSGHAVVSEGADHEQLLFDATNLLHDRFDIEHVTLQIESVTTADALQQPCLPGSTACYVDTAGMVVNAQTSRR